MFTEQGSKLNLKKKTVTTTLLIVLGVMFTFTMIPSNVKAASVEVSSVLPASHHGKVNEEVRIIGTINTTDGLYQVWFADKLVTSKSAIENSVDVTFSIPNLPGGNYTITLNDFSKNINATTWFYVDIEYYIKAITTKPPKQLQEGDAVVLNVSITGGEPNTVYYANISVKPPNPIGTYYSAIVTLTTTSTGYGSTNITYPTMFPASSTKTSFTGVYRIYFNKTQNMAENEFFIGLTNLSEYHREDLVEINAVGYLSNESAMVIIRYQETNVTLHSEEVKSSEQGIITTTWTTPWNASIGDYNITVYSENTNKTILDSQLFTVPGYPIDIHTRNLAGDGVPQILVEALDEATNITVTNSSESNGITHLWLENGNHSFEAFWRDVKVGGMSTAIIGENVYDLTCELTNIKVKVEDKNENPIPFVKLSITFEYVTTNENKVEKANITGETNISGVFYFNSALPRKNYTIIASRYGSIFNFNDSAIIDLPAEPLFSIIILCPSKVLTLKVTEDTAPLQNARLELVEQLGGISYRKIPDDTGIISLNVTFGKYRLKIYKNTLLINETLIEIFNDTYQEINCKYCNLPVSVRIIDYFGQPIPNSNVTLYREGMVPQSNNALANGTAIFNKIIGGNIQITVNLPGKEQLFVATFSSIQESTEIKIKVDKYVMLGGSLIETTLLTTILIVIAMVIPILFIELYKSKYFKLRKTNS